MFVYNKYSYSHNEKKEAIDLLNKLLFRGRFLPEEFNTITKVAQMIIFMFMLGLSIVIYSLLVHEIQTRLHIHKLLYALGYTRLQVFFYEFTYEMWDLFLGFIVNTIVFTRLILWIIERKEITEISDVVPLYLGTYPFLYILVLFILFGLNIVCCVLKISIRKERDIFKDV